MAAEMREALRIPKGSFVLANLNMLYKLDAKIVRQPRRAGAVFRAFRRSDCTALHGTGPLRTRATVLHLRWHMVPAQMWGMAAQMWPVCRARRVLHCTTAQVEVWRRILARAPNTVLVIANRPAAAQPNVLRALVRAGRAEAELAPLH